MKNSNELPSEEVEEAVWEEKRKRLSSVWIVPIVALVVGAWLIIQSINEKGTEIHITFKSAEGVTPGKTVIKYKDIQVGKVTEVEFSNDLKKVIVTAEMDKTMNDYLSDKTTFWIKTAQLSLNKVEGLDTLLSGVYIVMAPKKGKGHVKEFMGLDHIPVVSNDTKGTTYILKANTIGSLDVGSPIYYKKLQAGTVTSYALDPDGKKISVNIFIKSPFNKLINEETRFWNASGVSANISADGVEIQTESLTSILSGGISFDNMRNISKGKPVAKNHIFTLFPSKKKAKHLQYNREVYFWVYSNSSIRGLSEGAPVEFRGVKIGDVVSFSLLGDAKRADFEIPILIRIQPGRFMIFPNDTNSSHPVNTVLLKKLIEKGLRAQLKSGNLLTGELYLDLNLYKNVPYASLVKRNGLYVLPTVPATMESLKSDIQTILGRVAAIPFEDIGKELQLTLKDLHTGTLPKLDKTIDSTDQLMKGAGAGMQSLQKNYLDSNAEINKKIIRLLEEMTNTSRSVKSLTDYLKRHPDSLIKGK